jgi:hypothetical protein
MFTSVATGTGTSSPETVTFTAQTAQYIRVVLTASSSTNWWSIVEFTAYTNGSGGGGGGGGGNPPPTGGSLGPNVYVFTPAMSQSSIQGTLNTIANEQVSNQFGTQRFALLFEPGTYGSAASPLDFTVGYYTEVAGLGQNPGQVVINGAINAFNQCQGGGYTNCNATDNFWRSMSNLTVNVMGNSGCYSGADFWAVSQASPMRRVHINGNLTLMDYCTGAPDYASGGFIADSQFTGGTITNGSQQQFMTRNSAWTGGATPSGTRCSAATRAHLRRASPATPGTAAGPARTPPCPPAR